MAECHITLTEPFDLDSVCRLCLSPVTDAIRIFSEDSSLVSVITSFASIKVCQDDGLPAQICQPCHHQLFTSYEFYLKCREADTLLRKIADADCQGSREAEVLQGGPGEEPECRSEVTAESCAGIDVDTVPVEEVTLVEVFADFDDDCMRPDGELETSPGEPRRREEDDDLPIVDPEEVAPCPSTEPGETGPDAMLVSAREFECGRCGEMFAHRNDLWHHESLHLRGQGLDCRVCSKHFPSSYYLNVHMRVHTGFGPYKCKQCNSSFAQRGTLQSHMKKHADARPHKRGFSGKGSPRVRQGPRASDPLDVELNECPLCDKAFVHSSGLSRHLSLHAAGRPFTCDLCGKHYKELPSLRRHMSIKHGFC